LTGYVFEKFNKKKLNNSPSSGVSTISTTHDSKKFVSVGDYDISKIDINLNYGYFASALEDEQKEIKIGTLNLISIAGSNYENFAKLSFKYISELINDEEDEVRYFTVNTMEALIKKFKYIEVR
jgi:hypothetical protein